MKTIITCLNWFFIALHRLEKATRKWPIKYSSTLITNLIQVKTGLCSLKSILAIILCDLVKTVGEINNRRVDKRYTVQRMHKVHRILPERRAQKWTDNERESIGRAECRTTGSSRKATKRRLQAHLARARVHAQVLSGRVRATSHIVLACEEHAN